MKVSILIVEDDPALNEAYEMILQTAGYHTYTALNGQEALELIEAEDVSPDIILLDLRMPVLDGIGFLRKYRPSLHPTTTVVVFGNYDAHGDIEEAYKLGAHRYILKARAAPKELLHLVEGIASEKVHTTK